MKNQSTSAIRDVVAIQGMAPMPISINPLPAVVEQTALVVFGKFSDKLKAKLNGRVTQRRNPLAFWSE